MVNVKCVVVVTVLGVFSFLVKFSPWPKFDVNAAFLSVVAANFVDKSRNSELDQTTLRVLIYGSWMENVTLHL